jgi:glutathione S-transferase|nr:hypothetical protein [Kofleriaceae bacterium]
MLEFVDAATARTLPGTRMVVSAIVPSPWSEAAKGLFRVAGLRAAVVRAMPRDKDLAAWTGVDNVPVVLHDDEPARTNWAAIVGLVARLAPGTVLPAAVAERAEVMGWLDAVAGEDGLAWTGRLAMIERGLATRGELGFAPPAAGYLGKRYGFASAGAADDIVARASAHLAALAARLGARDYFGGARPNALDIYVATALTALTPLTEADCPRMSELGRRGFAGATAALGAHVPPSLRELRARMFDKHLAYPIEL